MIDALITGKLFTPAQERTGKSGKPFVTAKMTTSASDGASLFVNIIAFEPDACRALLALETGDAMAVAGPATPKTWTDKDGNHRPALDVVAQQVLTAYHVNRKRSAMHPAPAGREPPHKDEAWRAAVPIPDEQLPL